MPFDIRFPNGEMIRDLPDDTPQQFLAKIYDEWKKWGSLAAISNRQKVMGLIDDTNFLNLPRVERHRVFNESAKNGAWWDKLTPEQHRLIRGYVVDREGANPKDRYDYWEDPIRWDEQTQDPNGGFLAEIGNALERGAPKVASYFMRAAPSYINSISKPFMEHYLDYIAPLVAQGEVGKRPEMREAALGAYTQATGELAEKARQLATDVSVGAELLAPPPKIGTWGEVHGWDDFTMYIAQAVGTQAPIMGSIMLAGAVNPGLGLAAGMALETGTISEDLQRQGFDDVEADRLASVYGTLAGALEAAPITHFLSRNPVVSSGLRQFIGNRLKSMGIQAIEEAFTEGPQTLLEQAAVDFAYANQGELEKISWNTPEGRKSLWDEVKESMIQGALMGGGMGMAIGHKGPQEAPGSREEENAPAPGAAPITPGGAAPATAPANFAPISPGEAPMVNVVEDLTAIPTEESLVAPSRMFEQEEIPTREFAPYEPTAEDLATMGPPTGEEAAATAAPRLAARRLAKSKLGQRTLEHRRANPEETARWFNPLTVDRSDGTGWLLFNENGTQNPDTDQVVFATGEVGQQGGEDGIFVVDQDGNRTWRPLVNQNGQPNFYTTTEPGGMEYLRQRSAETSEQGKDITEAADGLNHPYNAQGMTRQDQKEVGEEYVDEEYRRRLDEFNRVMAIQRHVREYKLNPFRRDPNQVGLGLGGKDVYTDEIAGEFVDVRKPFISKEGLGWDDLATSLYEAGLVDRNVEIDEAWLNDILGQVFKKPVKRAVREELLGKQVEGRYVPPEPSTAKASIERTEGPTQEELFGPEPVERPTAIQLQRQMREAAAKEGNELDDVQDLTARIYAGEHATDLLRSEEFKGKVTGAAADLAIRLSEAVQREQQAAKTTEQMRKEAAPTLEEMEAKRISLAEFKKQFPAEYAAAEDNAAATLAEQGLPPDSADYQELLRSNLLNRADQIGIEIEAGPVEEKPGIPAQKLHDAALALETFRRNAKLEAEESGRKEADVLASRADELNRLEAAVQEARKPFEVSQKAPEGETEEQAAKRKAKTNQMIDILLAARNEAYPLEKAEKLMEEEAQIAFEFEPVLTQEKAERIAKKKTERRRSNLPLFADQVDEVEAEDIIESFNQQRVNQNALNAGHGAFAQTIAKALKEVLPAHIYQGLVRARYAGGLNLDATTSADYWRTEAKRILSPVEFEKLIAKAEKALKQASDRWQTQAQENLFETKLQLERTRAARDPKVNLKHVQNIFKGWKIQKAKKGALVLTRPGVRPLRLFKLGDVTELFEDKDLRKFAANWNMDEEEMREGLKAGKLTINGSYSFNTARATHQIALASPSAMPTTLYHEAFHFAFHNYLTSGEMKQLLEAYGSEEEAAVAFGLYADARYAKQEAQSKTQAVFNKIYETALQILEWAGIKVDPTLSLMRKIADGKIWDRQDLGYSWDDYGNVRWAPEGPAPAPMAALASDIANAVKWDDPAAMEKQLSQTNFKRDIEGAAAIVPAETTKADGDLGAPVVRIQNPTTFFEIQTVGNGETTPTGGSIAPETLTEWMRDKVIRRLFDKLEPLRRFQEELTEDGENIIDGLNAYVRARNFTPRAGALMNWIEKNLTDPLLEELGRLGVDHRAFEYFLMAIDALEDNPRIYRMHVVTPKAIAQKELARLREIGIRRGQKVEVPGHPNQVGKVARVVKGEHELREGEHGQRTIGGEIPATVEISWRDSVTGEENLEEFELSEVRRTAVAEQEKKIADIDEMVRTGNVPHTGLSSDDARRILTELRDQGWIEFEGETPTNATDYTGKFRHAWDLQRKIVRWKENMLLASGLITEDALKAWRKDHKRYTPMRGKTRPDIGEMIYGGERPPLPEIEDYGGSVWLRAVQKMANAAGYKGELFRPNIGRGYNPGKRRAMEYRLGRHSFPSHSTLVELLTDTRELAVRAERNRVAQTVWNLFQQLQGVRDANGDLLFDIDTKPMKRIYDEKAGKIREVVDDVAYRSAQIYDVWIDGTHHFIRGVSPDMAGLMATLNNIGPAAGFEMLRWGAAINRYLSRMATSRNPAFAIPNVVRDFTTAGIRLTTKYKDLGPKILKDVPKSFNLIRKYNRNPESLSETDRRRVEEWKSSGGETAYWTIPNFETQTDNLGKRIKQLSGDQNKLIELGSSVIRWLEDYNGALEAAARFTTFEAARANGASIDKAALMSREVTVDFNQQGQEAGHLGTFWMFANASLQGSRMVYDSLLKTKNGRRWLLGLMAAGFTQAVIGRVAGGDDPEDGVPYWDKKTAYEKSRNINVMIPGTKGKSMKIPLPWGFNLPFMAGAMIADVVAPKMGLGGKGMTAGEAAMNTIGAASTAFNPIGDADLSTLGGWVQLGMPSWLQPVPDIALNKTFWGGPIAPEETAYKKSEQYGIKRPAHERYFSSVSAPSKEFTKLLSKFGIEISPEHIDYTIGWAFGGLGDTVNKFVSAPITLAKNGRLASYEMPIVRSFYAEESSFYAPQVYRANLGDFWLAYETYNELQKEDPGAAAAYFDQKREILQLHDAIVTSEKVIRQLKDAGVNINDSRQQRVFKRMNRMYQTAEDARIRRLKKK